jgi:DNA-binding LytR/AlgR family response regulator
MKVLIIEDELPSSRRLERFLFDFDIEIMDTLKSIKSTVTWFKKNNQPDLIFLDIQLSDGLCFEIFNQIKVTSKIIFTTAFSNYSIKAFDYNSISYLLKPIDKVKLAEAIEKAKKTHQKDIDLDEFKKLINNYKIENYKESFTVKVGNKIKIIETKDICCFYSFENATYLKTNSLSHILNYSLTSLESDLNPEQFFRVNRTFLININEIKHIISYANSRLKLILNSYTDSEIIVSRERVKEFKEFIQ